MNDDDVKRFAKEAARLVIRYSRTRSGDDLREAIRVAKLIQAELDPPKPEVEEPGLFG